MLDLKDIEREVRSHASVIGASAANLPTFGHSEDFARPHIEVDHAGYHWVVVERGEERDRFTTCDLDNLLYQVFRGVTHQLASDYELAHRDPTKDLRRILFARQVELMTALSPKWAQQEGDRHSAILAAHPFDDNSHRRIDFLRALRAQGLPYEEANRRASEAYPGPKGTGRA